MVRRGCAGPDEIGALRGAEAGYRSDSAGCQGSGTGFMHQVYIRTYGCQMNERDSDQVAQMFLDRGGYVVTEDEGEADVILINTCSVRDQAEQKALGKMGMMGKYRRVKPHVVYGFLGCMAQSRGEELIRDIPHLDLVAGTQKYHRVVDYVDALLKTMSASALWMWPRKKRRRTRSGISGSRSSRRPPL
jgi:tRNA A37 methylthiotransferase MiaB